MHGSTNAAPTTYYRSLLTAAYHVTRLCGLCGDLPLTTHSLQRVTGTGRVDSADTWNGNLVERRTPLTTTHLHTRPTDTGLSGDKNYLLFTTYYLLLTADYL